MPRSTLVHTMPDASHRSATWGLRTRLVTGLVSLVLMTLMSASVVLQWRASLRQEQQENQRWQARAADLSALSSQLLWSDGSASKERTALPNAARFAAAERALHSLVSRSPGLHSVQIFIFHPGRATSAGETTDENATTLGLEVGSAPEAPQPTPAARLGRVTLPTHREGLIAIDMPLYPLGGFDTRARNLVQRIWVRPAVWYARLDWTTPLIFSLAIAIVLVTLAGISLELWVHQPLRSIQSGFAQVAEGQVAVEVEPSGAPEFRQIAAEFNHMSRALDQQRGQLAEQAQAMARHDRLAALGRLSAGLAHEIGNPLSAMLGYTQLLADPRSRDMTHPERQELLARIAAQIERIKDLVGELGEFARPSERPRQPVNANALVRSCTELLAADPRFADVRFELEGEQLPELWTVPQVVQQVLLNLAVNAGLAAVKGRERPHVNLRTTLAEADGGALLTILVRDSGPGIADELAGRIFDPFFTTRDPGQGTGLGLAISSELCRSLGGQLDLLSSHDREHDPRFVGAQFRMRLPVEPPGS